MLQKPGTTQSRANEKNPLKQKTMAMFSGRNSTQGLKLIQMANSEGSSENKGG